MYKQVVAIGVIHRALAPGKAGDTNKGIAPVAPEMESIQPGTTFVAGTERSADYGGKSEYEHLKAIGVIRDYVGSERSYDDLESAEVRARQSAADIAEQERRAAEIKAIADAKAAQDAARAQLDSERKAKEEADRLAQEDADRKAKEEAAADKAAADKAKAKTDGKKGKADDAAAEDGDDDESVV